MSFPIVHSMVGYAVYRAGTPKERSWKKALLCAFIASAADLDYIPGILVGNPLLFHRSVTHSIVAAIVCGLGVAILARLFTKEAFGKTFFLSSAIYLTHPLLDLLPAPAMMPLFWPLQPAGLVHQAQVFQSLPIHCHGVKDFACAVFMNFSYIQRFWLEIIFLGSSILLLIFRNAFRRLWTLSERKTVLES